MEKCVHWLTDKNVPLFQKIALVFSVTLAAVGTGLFIGYPILFSAAVLVPLAIWGKLSMNELARKTIDEYRKIFLEAMNEAFDGKQTNFPVLDSESWKGARSITEAWAIGMSKNAPAIRGQTPDGRPFFGLKAVQVGKKFGIGEKPTMLVIYKRFNNETILTPFCGSPRLLSDWHVELTSGSGEISDQPLNAEHLEKIQQLFVTEHKFGWQLAE